jgi:hypothetical protein
MTSHHVIKKQNCALRFVLHVVKETIEIKQKVSILYQRVIILVQVLGDVNNTEQKDTQGHGKTDTYTKF